MFGDLKALGKSIKVSSINVTIGDLSFNETDLRIINSLYSQSLSIGNLTKELNIAPINTWKHLKILKNKGYIHMPEVKRGKKKILELTEKGKKLYNSYEVLFELVKSIDLKEK